jgi:hypothetical protein
VIRLAQPRVPAAASASVALDIGSVDDGEATVTIADGEVTELRL